MTKFPTIESLRPVSRHLPKQHNAHRQGLLLRDFKLPGLNGSELAAKAVKRAEDLPVRVIIGYATLEIGWPPLARPLTYSDLPDCVRGQTGALNAGLNTFGFATQTFQCR